MLKKPFQVAIAAMTIMLMSGITAQAQVKVQGSSAPPSVEAAPATSALCAGDATCETLLPAVVQVAGTAPASSGTAALPCLDTTGVGYERCQAVGDAIKACGARERCDVEPSPLATFVLSVVDSVCAGSAECPARAETVDMALEVVGLATESLYERCAALRCADARAAVAAAVREVVNPCAQAAALCERAIPVESVDAGAEACDTMLVDGTQPVPGGGTVNNTTGTVGDAIPDVPTTVVDDGLDVATGVADTGNMILGSDAVGGDVLGVPDPDQVDDPGCGSPRESERTHGTYCDFPRPGAPIMADLGLTYGGEAWCARLGRTKGAKAKFRSCLQKKELAETAPNTWQVVWRQVKYSCDEETFKGAAIWHPHLFKWRKCDSYGTRYFRTAARLTLIAPTAIKVGNPSNKKSPQAARGCRIV